MNGPDAAQELYASLKVQKGKVNVAACEDGTHGYILKVWVAPGTPVIDIPLTYQGFPVVVEPRPTFEASQHRLVKMK